MDGWQKLPLWKVIQLQYGKPLDTNDRNPAGLYPVYGANGEKDRTDKFCCDKPSIIVGRKGSAGEVTLTEDKFWPLDVTYFVEFDRNRHDLRFLYHLLTTLNLPSLAKGVKPGINRNEVYALPVNVPSLAQQRRIVAILDEAFEAIARAKANTEKNLQNAREVFTSEVASIFATGRSDWPVKTLPELSQNLDSKRVPITKSSRKTGEYPYYGASGIVDYVAEYIFDENTLLISEDGANLLARSTPIAFSVSGKYWVNNHAHILRFNDMRTQRFVEYYMESIPLDSYITGAAQPKLNQKALNSIPIPIPDNLDGQQAVVVRIEGLEQQTESLKDIGRHKLAALDELKKSLLHQAFTGQLTAKATDSQLAEVA
ncbi:MAG: restriction endonuclease subunit S [Candidatus Accumulibacter sp.]|uniref:restriction endonuclease subunit S n=1 Tax=Accumulibacter sp. TaxID=2053492 RepID=UPI0025D8CA9A|nr:restriction endonuclease subunit S [Accumulibacter sp.]MCM8597571.1 restriction endonuclease subunit S [Accumulibacter sp.]